LLIGARKKAEKIEFSAAWRRMSGRTRRSSALRFVGSDQLQDLGLKRILRGVNGADRLSERLLLEFVFNRQAEFSELFNIAP
jgi:hypothetical protein